MPDLSDAESAVSRGPLPTPVVPGGWGGPRFSTGLDDLDAVVGGVGTGELWVLTGAPGQGRSTLLTQLAARLACAHGLPTWVVSDRDPAHMVSGRLYAGAARVPLGHIADDRLDGHDRDRLASASERLNAAPLTVVAGSHARHRTTADLHQRAHSDLLAAMFDDPDWHSDWELSEARRLADRGAVVVVTRPRSRVLTGPAYRSDLHPGSELADVIVEVRHYNLAVADIDPSDDQPGYAALVLLRNRRGPTATITVAFQGHYARFVDIVR